MSKDYKGTLNLPQTDFPMKANLAQREPEMLKAWDDMRIYQRVQEKNKSKTPYKKLLGVFVMPRFEL